MANYEPKAIINKISATSRASIKIRDSFYTCEYTEERIIPDIDGIDIAEERKALWDTVDDEVDAEINRTYNSVTKCTK